MPLPDPWSDPEAQQRLIMEQDQVLEAFAAHLVTLSAWLRSYGFDHLANQVDRIG